MTSSIKAGIIGCGAISQAYFNGCKLFRAIDLVACADLNPDAARAKAEQNNVRAMSVDELLADPDIQIVINLTVPQAHAKVSMQILQAGKHVHLEKPLAMSVEEGAAVLKLANERNLRVSCAPDTFLGSGQQTSRKLIDDGYIGKPLSGTAMMLGPGVENWHQSAEFYYKKGGGPMFDMGPYYINALVNLLGPVQAVTGICTKGYAQRTITTAVNFGKVIDVDVPTHYSGNLVFSSGAIITMMQSFDVRRHKHSSIEIYGTEGSLVVPDPNTFGGPVSLYRPGNEDWSQCALTHPYKDNSRGMGVADLAQAILEHRPHRCSAELALHAVEVMEAFEKSSESGCALVTIHHSCPRPAALSPRQLPSILS
ncbi:MAG: Gfo/Idh/MocA family oxidoreductase [Verrucomicrobia bacterium]|nr:Gfo/Idh/MocA family oxidoreductase [Verrucomicrobiota bacterium]